MRPNQGREWRGGGLKLRASAGTGPVSVGGSGRLHCDLPPRMQLRKVQSDRNAEQSSLTVTSLCRLNTSDTCVAACIM